MSETEEILDELQKLARLVSRMPDLEVVAGRGGSGFSFNHVRRVISMDEARLHAESRNFLRGLVLHELAHAVLTRVHRHATSAFSRRIFFALNALEDTRIENWLLERFPGSRPWIEEYNGKFLRNTVPEMQEMLDLRSNLPPLHELIASLMARWWHGQGNISIPDRCVPLLEQVWPSFQQHAQTHPESLPSDEVQERYDRSEVRQLYVLDDRDSPPDEFEKSVRLAQADAWKNIEENLLPVFRKLVPPEHRSPMSSKIAMFVQWSGALHTEAHHPGRHVHTISQQVFDEIFGKSCSAKKAPPWVESVSAYDLLVEEQADVIEALIDAIEDAFPPERSRNWIGPRQSGTRLKLKSIPQAEADPRRAGEIWDKKSSLLRPKPHVVVLIDRSGSMTGERIKAATAGAVLLAEASRRADLPLSLFAFNNTCDALIEPEDSLEEKKGRIGGLVDAASGGTDMAQALKHVAKHLEESYAAHRMLVVLGDGEDDSAQIGPILKSLKASGVCVLALGVGESDGMKNLFNRAQVGLNAAAIPAAFGKALRYALRMGL